MEKIFIILITITMAVFSFADTIELKDGKIVKGKIVNETADCIKVDEGVGVVIPYFKDELKSYSRSDVSEKEIKLPVAFTMDELTPEQRKYVEENYISTGPVATLNLTPGGVETKIRPANAEELTEAAYKLLKRGYLKEALVKAQEAIEQDKDYLPAYRIMADALQESGSPEKSIPIYDKILEKRPNDNETYTNRGYAYLRLNQFSRAIEDFSKALELNPKDVNAISDRATAYFKAKEVDLAKKDYEKLMEFDQKQANFGLGNIATYYHKWQEAIDYYDRTVAVSPNFAEAYIMKGQVLLELGRKAEAVEAIKRAKSLGLAIPSDLEAMVQAQDEK
jgi:tetratricopeptide (TPR) repeat protein